MNNITKVIIAIGLAIALIVLGYNIGYQIGHTFGEDIVPKERIEVDIIDIPIIDTSKRG